MTKEKFEILLDELDGTSLETLKMKNAKYSSPDDALHNFNRGAELMGVTPAMAAWGYLTKHLTALSDRIHNNDFSDRDDFLEKCQDSINYIRFIWCIGNDRINKPVYTTTADDDKATFTRSYELSDHEIEAINRVCGFSYANDPSSAELSKINA